MKVALIVGTRPNIVKAAPLMRQFRHYSNEFDIFLIHTGQHYSHNLSQGLISELELPDPDSLLSVGSGTHAQQTAESILQLESCFLDLKPDLVIVFGDVNSTMAAAMTASKLHIKVAHVEAGLRSFNTSMPEEVNRLVTDHLSDFLFVSEESGVDNLIREGIPADKIFYSGNIMIDSLVWCLREKTSTTILEDLQLRPYSYAVLTLHRPSNVDDRTTLNRIIRAMIQIAETHPVVFPCHPRTLHRIESFGILPKIDASNIQLMEPASYGDFLWLQSNSKVVFTDSGGVQEETTYLGTPCVTFRENTERPSTVEIGSSVLCGTNICSILEAAKSAFSTGRKKTNIPPLWDGITAHRIVQAIRQRLIASSGNDQETSWCTEQGEMLGDRC
ncbi:MAG: UDP-N-acetylglucosamine 2-epimerase (non-hydrolyzing) [FCB group bacterium]|nr:UDP-N-acetylglucosamine 2-epimerase (non-hydrolyzing) [FCB group bacterium]